MPVLIARRFPYVTFKVFSACGVIFHQSYNQLFPAADLALANEARTKHLLGFHDMRIGNQPDSRLIKFLTKNLPAVLPAAREAFESYRDLLDAFVSDAIDWPEFAARVRRRRDGGPEGFDEGQASPEPDDYY